MPKRIKIIETAYASMLEHALRTYPDECCGALSGDTDHSVYKTIELKNSSRQGFGSDHFVIDPLELYHIESELGGDGSGIIGFYHSHPDKAAIPSALDREYMIPGLLYIIISVVSGKPADVRGYMLNSEEDHPIEVEPEISGSHTQTKENDLP